MVTSSSKAASGYACIYLGLLYDVLPFSKKASVGFAASV